MPGSPWTDPEPVPILIRGATLLDGVNAPDGRPRSLLVEAGRIRALGPSGEVQAPQGALVIDAAGCTLMPGMIDCHDHLASIPGSMAERAQVPPSLGVLRAAAAIEDTLQAGFTAIRDAGGLDLGLKMAVEQGLVPGPRLRISVNILSQTGGQNSHIEPSGIDSHFPVLPGIPPSICDGVEACRLRTREMIQAGADWIKIATTGGVSTPIGGPLTRQFSREEVAAIVDTAHAAGKPVMCHAYGGEGARIAIECGVQSIEHGAALERDDLEAMERKGIWLVPTFSVLCQVVGLADQPRSPLPPYVGPKARALLDRQRTTFATALETGVRIALGTDAGGLGHGHNAREFGHMVDAGMAPLHALASGTSEAARLIGLGEETGSLSEGKAADLLLIDGDPLQRIQILEDRAAIRLILRAGRIFKNTAPRPDAGGVRP